MERQQEQMSLPDRIAAYLAERKRLDDEPYNAHPYVALNCEFADMLPPLIAAYRNCLDALKAAAARADRLQAIIDGVQGALADAGTVLAQREDGNYGESVRALTKERDTLRRSHDGLFDLLDRLEAEAVAITPYPEGYRPSAWEALCDLPKDAAQWKKRLDAVLAYLNRRKHSGWHPCPYLPEIEALLKGEK